MTQSQQPQVIGERTLLSLGIVTPEGIAIDGHEVAGRELPEMEVPERCLWFDASEFLLVKIGDQVLKTDLFDQSQTYYTKARRPAPIREALLQGWGDGLPASVTDYACAAVAAAGIGDSEQVVHLVHDRIPRGTVVARPFRTGDTILNLLSEDGASDGMIEGLDPYANSRRDRVRPYVVEVETRLHLLLGKSCKGDSLTAIAGDIETRKIPVKNRDPRGIPELPANCVAFQYCDIAKVNVRNGLQVETEVFNRSPMHVVRVIADPCRFQDLVPEGDRFKAMMLDAIVGMTHQVLCDTSARLVTAETYDGSLKVPFPVRKDDQVLNIGNPYKK